MTSFSKDADILRYEPQLFGELHFPGQVLAAGSGGVLEATTFTADGEDFTAAGVEAGGVIYLRGSAGGPDGAYEIVSVDSAEALTVSVLRADEQQSAVAPPAGSELIWRISTYQPQMQEVLFSLTQYFGIRPGEPDSEYGVEDILEPAVLRQASVFGVLAAVYATLAGQASDSEDYWRKSLHYQKLFEQARGRCRVSIDAGGDGVKDISKSGGDFQLQRD
jgi:hypothetical protein